MQNKHLLKDILLGEIFGLPAKQVIDAFYILCDENITYQEKEKLVPKKTMFAIDKMCKYLWITHE